jgi:glycerophosphoryl diester phosphodiesterase
LSALALGACSDRKMHPFFLTGPDSRRPFVMAHRGGGGFEPEATIPTFLANARRDPQAVIEFDVHRTRDGHLVVIHDAKVDRTTNGQGRVAELTLAELQALDAGHCASPGRGNGTTGGEECRTSTDPALFPFRGKGYQIPTLDELLQKLPAETFISVEVKAAGFERQVADALRASGRLERLVVGAEEDDVAVRMKDLLPQVAHYYPRGGGTCVALSAKLRIGYPACPEYNALAAPLSAAGLALDRHEVIEAAHARGVAVLYWTIQEEAVMERLLRLGADGIITDYPDRARAVIDRLRAAGAL